jgi:hypothetical protein
MLVGVAYGSKILNLDDGPNGPGIYYLQRNRPPLLVKQPKAPSCGLVCAIGDAATKALGCDDEVSCALQAGVFALPISKLKCLSRGVAAIAESYRRVRRTRILLAGGELIGRAGSSAKIREIQGGVDEAKRLFAQLSALIECQCSGESRAYEIYRDDSAPFDRNWIPRRFIFSGFEPRSGSSLSALVQMDQSMSAGVTRRRPAYRPDRPFEADVEVCYPPGA